jgi:hypothetical protein
VAVEHKKLKRKESRSRTFEVGASDSEPEEEEEAAAPADDEAAKVEKYRFKNQRRVFLKASLCLCGEFKPTQQRRLRSSWRLVAKFAPRPSSKNCPQIFLGATHQNGIKHTN